MHKSIKALKQAITELQVPFVAVDGFEDALIIAGGICMYGVTPFNSDSAAFICRDKAMFYKILNGSVVTPRTVSVVDPQGVYPTGVVVESIDNSLKKASGFSYPRIVKMNAGDTGRNVYRVDTEIEMRAAIAAIFNKGSKDYDFIALIQEYIPRTREIRVVIADRDVMYMYDRNTGDFIEGPAVQEITDMAKIILGRIDLSWCALDFIESNTGAFYFIEANTRPGFDSLIAKHGERPLIEAYKKGLTAFLKQKSDI